MRALFLRCWRNASPCAAALAVVALTAPALAHPATGPRVAPPPPPTPDLGAPPALPSDNAATRLARTLQTEIAALEARADAHDVVVAAERVYRRIAFDLLFHGASAPDQAMAMAGFRLADCRVTLGQLLRARMPAESGGPTVAAELARFVALGAHGIEPLPAPGSPETALAPLLEPLRRAVSVLEGTPVGAPDAWPSLAQVHARDTAAGSDGGRTRDSGGAGDAGTTAGGAVRTAQQALAAAAWLSPDERSAWVNALDGAQVSDPRVLTGLASFLQACTLLSTGEAAWDIARLRSAATALLANPTLASVDALAHTLICAHAARSFDLQQLAPHLRGPGREIQVQARRSAATLAGLLPRMVATPDITADPALHSAMDAQTGAAADLERLRAAGAWPDLLAGVRAGSREPFDRVVRAWAAALATPHQRAATRAAMDAFAAQLALFVPVRLETRLRMNDPAALAATAGATQALLAEIDRRRDLWAAAWARGPATGTALGADSAASGMLRAARVMDAVAAVTAFDAHSTLEPVLARWGGFVAPPGGLGVHTRTLAARAQIAMEALIAQRDSEVDTHLAALQRDVPVAWFAAHAFDTLEPWLAARGGVLAQLDAACSGPRGASWLGNERAFLMLFARYAREAAALQGAADAERVDALRLALASIARDIATRAGASFTASPLPALPGSTVAPLPPTAGSPTPQRPRAGPGH